MKRLLRFPVSLAWRVLGPIRRPLVREIETWLDRYLARMTLSVTEEANISLDFASGELARLQAQVESMRGAVGPDPGATPSEEVRTKIRHCTQAAPPHLHGQPHEISWGDPRAIPVSRRPTVPPHEH